ncbi:NF-X1-type zinc finger protein NFXL2-like protein [Drosera capensis]
MPSTAESSSSDSSDTDTAISAAVRRSDLSNSIFKSYLELNPQQKDSDSVDLTKIQSFLNSSSSGALSCLICLERIKGTDPTWSCNALCFAVFHLVCIQSWASQASSVSAARAVRRLFVSAEKAEEGAVWNCPKCRVEYPKGCVPKGYFCFCGKVENPERDPWVLPHSCGEVCGRALRHNCGHHCLLLCHPGPCPSCPKLVKSRCFCGAVEDVRRCGFKNFSCNGKCRRVLDCGNHWCCEICHEGECPPCREKGVYRCRCGKVEEERECFVRDFRCDSPCRKLLGCGKHVCERGCHEGGCGECPLQGNTKCPCGKRVYEGMACDVVVPLCGATCDKRLICGIHRCPERCHRGPCIETCRIMITKSCRCGGLKKQYVKESALGSVTVGAMHASAAAAMEIVLLVLRFVAGNSGARTTNVLPLAIGVLVHLVLLWLQYLVHVVKHTSRHAMIGKPHKCHYGACPKCKLPCGEEYRCGHTCNLRCHDRRPPPNSEFTLKPKKKKASQETEPTPGTPCPPCPELVWRSCVGQHIGAEKMMVCSDRVDFSCENLCGYALACGNHYCTKPCHALKNSSLVPDHNSKGDACEKCTLRCEKERPLTCPHPCPLPCHPEECSPCKYPIKRACHCGTLVRTFECDYWYRLSELEQISARSCGDRCHRKLPSCPHLCSETCHPGDCPSPEKCSKKVAVRCVCHNLKKEWLCQDVQTAYSKSGHDPKDMPKNQFGTGLLPCSSDCKSKVPVVESDLQLRKPMNLLEKQPVQETHVSKRRRKHQQLQEAKQKSKLQTIMDHLRSLALVVILLRTEKEEDIHTFDSGMGSSATASVRLMIWAIGPLDCRSNGSDAINFVET